MKLKYGLMLLAAGLLAAGCSLWKGPTCELTAENTEIVTAEDASDATKLAANELDFFLAKVFGKRVLRVTRPTEGRISLILGGNGWALNAGIDTATMPRDAFAIKQVGSRIFIAGRDDARANPEQNNFLGDECLWQPQFERGTLFGVYAFLEKYAGVRLYFPGELGTIVPRAEKIEVTACDWQEKPDYQVRRYGYADGKVSAALLAPGETEDDFKRKNFYRLRGETTYIPCCHGQNKFQLARRFGKDHPDYCALMADGSRSLPAATAHDRHGSLGRNQLCQSSGVWDEMYRDIVSYAKGEDASVRGIVDGDHPDRFTWGRNISGKYVDVMPQDGMRRCYCERCKKFFAPNGDDPQYATELIWSNTVHLANRLTAAGHDIHVTMMSYSPYGRVPAIEIPQNVDVMVARQGPWAKAMPEKMKKENGDIKMWADKLKHKVWLWNYPDKVRCSGLYLPDVPQMSPHAWGEYYEQVAPWIFGAFAESESDRWLYNHLNYYVFGKVCWDNKTDVDALLDEYYRLMYGAAAADMREFFEALERKWVYEVAGCVKDTPIGPKAVPPGEYQLWNEVYSSAVLKGYAAILDKAAEKVKPGSLEAKRVALMRAEFLAPMEKHGAEFRASIARERGIEARRGKADKTIFPHGAFDSLDGWTAKAERAVLDHKTCVTEPSLHLTAKKYACVKRPLPNLKPDTCYRISWFARVKNLVPHAKNSGLFVEFYDNDYRWFPHSSPLCGTTDWVYQSFETRTARTFDGAKQKPYVMVFVTGCTGDVWVDDLRFEEIPSATKNVSTKSDLKVLAIGNSYSVCTLREMPNVAAEMNLKLDLCSLYIGGCPLKRHWNNVEALSTNALFKPYSVTRNRYGVPIKKPNRANIPEALAMEKWDVVTIQQASHDSFKPETYEPYGTKLIETIRKYAPQAEIVVQETWSDQPESRRLVSWKTTSEELHNRIHAAYGDFAKRHGLRVIPTGSAVQLARARQVSTNGRPKKEDDPHLNKTGEYLQALTWTAKLFGVDVTACTYTPDYVNEETGVVLRKAAQTAVENK